MKLSDSKKMQALDSILNGNLDLIDQFDMNQVGRLHELIIIKPNQVRHILMRYLSGDVSDLALNQWAKFICSRLEYIVPGGDDDNLTDFYEDMYYVIQRISTPEIDGDINQERITLYLNELNTKYSDDVSPD